MPWHLDIGCRIFRRLLMIVPGRRMVMHCCWRVVSHHNAHGLVAGRAAQGHDGRGKALQRQGSTKQPKR
jgi:hypothetical protein